MSLEKVGESLVQSIQKKSNEIFEKFDNIPSEPNKSTPNTSESLKEYKMSLNKMCLVFLKNAEMIEELIVNSDLKNKMDSLLLLEQLKNLRNKTKQNLIIKNMNLVSKRSSSLKIRYSVGHSKTTPIRKFHSESFYSDISTNSTSESREEDSN